MAALSLWQPILDAPFFREIASRLERGEKGLRLTGLVAGSRALVLGMLAAHTGRPLMLVVPDDAAVEEFQRDLSAVAGLIGKAPRLVVMPALDTDPYAEFPPHPEVIRERVVALDRLQRDDVDILVVPVRALLHWLPSTAEWSSWATTVSRGVDLPPDRFVLQAMKLGYRRVDTVSAPGEVSRRGGIVDIFPPTLQEPVRIELFGDSVDSLRSFDTDNQRSTGQIDEVVVGPAVESPPTDDAIRRLSAYLEAGRDQAEGTDEIRHFRARLDVLTQQGYWPGLEALARLTVADPELLFAHASGFHLVVDEPERTDDELVRANHDLQQSYEQNQARVLPAPARLFADAREIRSHLNDAALALHELALGSENLTTACRSAPSYAGRIKDLVTDLRRARTDGVRTICVMRARGTAERLMEIFREYELSAARAEGPTVPGPQRATGGLFVSVGALRHGFEFPDLGLGVLSEREIFGEQRKPVDRKRPSRAAFIADFRDLKPGDMVVHVDHGIACFAGLGRPRGGSLNRDFMVLEFAGRDKLFVPVDRLDLVQRYSGVSGRKPSLDKLGGPGWDRVKTRVRKSIQSMAKELLDLYARRAAATGIMFSADTPWQKELEAAFPYDLTRDQERVLAEVKEEMESPRSMDRLLVGDVGFGKTEIAVRAAFKAMMDGYQVALLAPTTVLAFQHFETISRRYAPFPVRVEMVSRLRTPAQVKEILNDVELGTVDLLIGTHRMLSRDVKFKRLGLLVVDEEQRFGVVHKERLKALTVGVDVLSMTATPIPRTLQMSLAGVRDLSVIETPPPGRMAIQTYVVPFRQAMLAQVLRKELRRDGQVFVVHNEIETLPALARSIEEMVPEARIAVAHGKLAERKLETIMLQLVRHEVDILVTTTIIENGLDIPRANTIIINDAHRFGLAQLYQLRGRVGRSQVRAYAYLLVPSRHELSSEARQRLKALQEFSELGSGFRLAAADLEIRGAGEMLGTRQHGHIAALGFDMYCQILERAVQELKGEPVKERRPANLHLGVDIKIPQSYLPDEADRLALYKRLAQADDESRVDRLRAETEDRFGHLPQAARNLFNMAELRLIAENVGVKSVNMVEDKLQIRFHELPSIEPSRIVEMLSSEEGVFTPSGMLLLPAPPRGADRLESVAQILRRILGRSAA